ncbi:MAG: hypothetical protein LBC82_02225 [Oscillospiraceae bacterium]|nr:hypothetical protein [Oscillospiraceae bacterium]
MLATQGTEYVNEFSQLEGGGDDDFSLNIKTTLGTIKSIENDAIKLCNADRKL